MQTATERDLAGIAARRERESAVPEQVFDSETGRCEGEELRRIREARSPERRFERIEERLDSLEPSVARVEGKLDILVSLAEKAEERKARSEQESHRTERVRIGSRAKIVVGVATALGVIAGAIATALSGCT